MMNYSISTTEERIEAQEKKDRYVASKCLKQIFKAGRDLQITPTEITEHYDLDCSVINRNDKTIPFHVEIKERNKTEEQIEKYPNAELKVSKYRGMRESTPKGTRLLYMVLLNSKTCLLFDLDNIDWEQVELRNWRIKITQMSDSSGYQTVPTFFIPYSLACATIDCSEYFNEYEWTTTIA